MPDESPEQTGNCVIIGASGGIGQALVNQVAQKWPRQSVYAFSRTPCPFNHDNVQHDYIDIECEQSIVEAAEKLCRRQVRIDTVIVASGILHTSTISPEKTFKKLDPHILQQVYAINAIGPMLIAKHFIPLMSASRPIFAALSARVGSIGDNRYGGWYAYRASKAALNMMLKTLSIESTRRYPGLIVAGLHPGTVDSPLTRPFQRYIPASQLFSSDYAAARLLAVLESLAVTDSGKVFAYDGKVIEP